MIQKKTRNSLLKGSGLVIFLLVSLGVVSLIRITITHKDIVDVSDIDLPIIEILTQIETNQLEQSILLERAIRYAQEGDADLARVNFVKSDSSFRYLALAVDMDLISLDEEIMRALENTQEKAHLMMLRDLHLSIRKLEIDHTNYEDHALEVLILLEQGDLEQGVLKSHKVEVEEDEFNRRIEETLVRHEMFTETIVNIVEEEQLLSRDWIIILTLSFVIVALALAYVYSYRIWRPLEDIRQGALQLGDGQLDTRVKIRGTGMTEDIVMSFNSMAIRLQKAQKEIDNFVQFSYRTSHDMKSPLANVKSLVKMLDKEMVEANFDAVVGNISKSVDQLESTVIALAKVNQLREDLKTDNETLSFEEMTNEILGTLTTQVEESQASIKMDFTACPNIFYPKPHLRSILQNLLTNAMKYRDPQKSLVIEIQSSTKNNKVFLSMRDNGLGFDSVKHHTDTFKPFQRFHTHQKGTGLGLYILRTIIEFHNGNVRVKSLPKKGAHFLLRLN